jgi:hypothetical protein
MNNTTKIAKIIQAISAAITATPPRPRSAATTARTKKKITHPNIPLQRGVVDMVPEAFMVPEHSFQPEPLRMHRTMAAVPLRGAQLQEGIKI